MDGKATRPSVSSGNELGVKRVGQKEIDKSERMGKWKFKLATVEWKTTERNTVELTDSDNDAGNSSDSNKKGNGLLKYGSSLIMRFKEKIQDIIDGVALKLKGDKEKDTKKSKEETERNEEDTQK